MPKDNIRGLAVEPANPEISHTYNEDLARKKQENTGNCTSTYRGKLLIRLFPTQRCGVLEPSLKGCHCWVNLGPLNVSYQATRGLWPIWKRLKQHWCIAFQAFPKLSRGSISIYHTKAHRLAHRESANELANTLCIAQRAGVGTLATISSPPYQAPHIRPPISSPSYQAPHKKPPISDPPYQAPHIRPLLQAPYNIKPSISGPPFQYETADLPYQVPRIRCSKWTSYLDIKLFELNR